jgi:hypothetical protein
MGKARRGMGERIVGYHFLMSPTAPGFSIAAYVFNTEAVLRGPRGLDTDL